MSTNEQLAPLMTFTGPAGRTRWDENGALKTVDENEIVEEYDPRTGRYRGTRYEQESTNYLITTTDYSEFDTNGVTSQLIEGAVGSYAAIRVTETAENTYHRIGQGWGRRMSTGFWTLSALITAFGSPRNVSLQCFNTNGVNTGGANFSLVTGELNRMDGTAVEAYSIPLGSRTFIFCLTMEAPTVSSNSNIQIEIKQDTTTGYSTRAGDTSTGMDVALLQLEKGKTRTSFNPTTDEPITRARDDARFTNPENFNGFERGTFVVEFEDVSNDSYPTVQTIFGREFGAGRFFYRNNDEPLSRIRAYDGSDQRPFAESPDGQPVRKAALRWGGLQMSLCANGGDVARYPWNGTWGSGSAMFGSLGRWSGWGLRINFLPEDPSDEQMQRLTAVPRRTTIASGTILGDYDPNERLSLFKDRHGIKPVERDGDPVRFMLDLGPAGNHLQAAPESTGLIYRTDGERAWIEYNGVNDYFVYRAGPILRGNISVSVHAAFWKPESDNTYRAIVAQGSPGVDQDFEFLVRGGSVFCIFNKDLRVEKALPLGDYSKKWNSLRFSEVGGIGEAWLNGNQIGTVAMPSGQFGSKGDFRIGYNAASDRYWKGRLGRITLTADASQADRDAIDAEIIERYVSA